VIGLLGMNDGAYPRVQAARDFDLMASSWRAGDRSRREDDRYLFLEALLSARQTLYISWQGHSAADNSVRPPSVLVAQLLDVVNACWSPERKPEAQPLQPFSEAYFEAASPYQTFDVDWESIRPLALMGNGRVAMESVLIQARGADASAAEVAASPPTLTLADLQRLLRQPVDVFFRNRLQVEFDSLEELEQEDEPFALNHLQQHQAGAALLQAQGDAAALRSLHLAGTLPLGGFGTRVADELMAKAQTILQSRGAWLQRYPVALAALPVELVLPQVQEDPSALLATVDGGHCGPDPQSMRSTCQLTGTLSGVWSQDGNDPHAPCLQLAERTGAVLQGRNAAVAARLHVVTGLWVRHLAACTSGLTMTSVQLGVDGQVVLPPMSAAAATAALGQLAQAYTQAWAQPLPIACKTAWAYLLAERQNQMLVAAGKPAKDLHEAAREAFEGGQRGGELAESAYLQRAFASYDDLATDLPHWAQLLYGGLLAHIDLSNGGAAT